ncbi:ER membrane protein complex subunit 2 isoform X1 [Octopus bimaculoides]|uniref:ER membrane protein complex subunit 2 n=2 Tax=Octopus bimaculoides TaxID=37653 RepID=A0A0L8FKW0_OCTBM|nr:ER membrane protein complex subunit 2 isoform X1 [Octopus bimaculoides]|eukprot:XP_014788919.1 PREDICTED: ER membrane protein complex subunit 2-like [Octopus bimaculoides]
MAEQLNLSNFEDARCYLRKLREDQIRDAAMVVQIWEDVLMNYAYNLGDELWLIYEQVCIAALDCQRSDLVMVCIGELENKFPKSLRVTRLKGMLYEAQDRYEKAQQLYEHILAEDETNMFARKRQVAILKAQGKTAEAINKLNDYLKEFMTDFEAWMEQCDLYIAENDYAKASFCMEELILSNPHNHLYHLKYAEIKYTQGGPENLEIARAYFSEAAKLNPHNLRSLFGLLMTASGLAVYHSKNSKERQANTKYAMWAAEQINEVYGNELTKSQISNMKITETIEKLLGEISAKTTN